MHDVELSLGTGLIRGLSLLAGGEKGVRLWLGDGGDRCC